MLQARFIIALVLAALCFLHVVSSPLPTSVSHDDGRKPSPPGKIPHVVRSAGDHPEPHDPFWKQNFGPKSKDGISKKPDAARSLIAKSPDAAGEWKTKQDEEDVKTKKDSQEPTSTDALSPSSPDSIDDHKEKDEKEDMKTKDPSLVERFSRSNSLIMGVGGIKGFKYKDLAFKTKKPNLKTRYSKPAAEPLFIVSHKNKDRISKSGSKPHPKVSRSLSQKEDIELGDLFLPALPADYSHTAMSSAPAASTTVAAPTRPAPVPSARPYVGWVNTEYNETACAEKQALAQEAYDLSRAHCFTPGQPQTLSDEDCEWAAKQGPIGCCLAIKFTIPLSGICQRWWPDDADWKATVTCCKGMEKGDEGENVDEDGKTDGEDE